MRIIDASLVVALVTQDSRAPAVQALLDTWTAAAEELHAPELLPYEVANGLTRASSAGNLPPRLVPTAWRWAMRIPLVYHPLRAGGESTCAIARRLDRQNAYDAAYLALALELRAEVWTLDKKLARDAGDLGYPVKLVDAAA